MPQLDELNPINLSKAQPPITFAAVNARFLSQFPDGADELWSADIKACRHGALCEVFESILFVESTRSGHGTAHIFGIEFADGCVADVNSSRVSQQSLRKLRIFQPDLYVSIDCESGSPTRRLR